MTRPRTSAAAVPEPVQGDFRTLRYAIGDNSAADHALDRIEEYIDALVAHINAEADGSAA